MTNLFCGLVSDKPYVLDVMFRLAENYPVDLYYVMDLSYSMGDDKDKLAELGDALGKLAVSVYICATHQMKSHRN